MARRKTLCLVAAALALTSAARVASAQTPPPDRDSTWRTVTAVSLAVGAGSQLLMPRVFYSDPESTVGWKGRWHVSVLAPVMTLTALTVLNEYTITEQFGKERPGCDASNHGGQHCERYGMPSTYAFASFSALGHGTGVFLVDSLKWSKGRVNGGALAGDVALPLVAAVVTGIGRSAGNFESNGQIIAGGAAGLGFGFLSGVTYALMQRPECGYSGSLICW